MSLWPVGLSQAEEERLEALAHRQDRHAARAAYRERASVVAPYFDGRSGLVQLFL